MANTSSTIVVVVVIPIISIDSHTILTDAMQEERKTIIKQNYDSNS
jgi:hypothetical protein